MRPGQLTPNEFEIALLEKIAESVPTLKPRLGDLRVLSREYTGVGSFTHFAALEPSLELPDSMPSVEMLISMPGVSGGLDAYLAIGNGTPEFLEVFTYGDEPWDGNYEGFQLVEYDG